MTASNTLFAAIRALKEIVVSGDNQALGIRFTGHNGQEYLIEVPEPFVGMLAIALMGKAADLPNANQMQPTTLDASRGFITADGRAGIEMTIERNLRVPLLAPPDQIEPLRKALEEVSAHSTGLSRRPH